jgi:hypothetical protein
MRVHHRFAILVSLLALSNVHAARAQDRGQVGVVAGFPASIGVIWYASDKVAVRPEFSFTTGSAEITTTPLFPAGSSTLESSSWSFSTGVSALFFVARTDALRMYVSPRYAYSHSSSDSSSSIVPETFEISGSGSGHQVAGSFGAQYLLGQRFGVFGEIGAGFIHSTSKSGNAPIRSETTTNAFGTRGGVGVIVLF